MKKIFIALVFVMLMVNVARADVNYWGRYVHLNGDTLGTDSTWYSCWLNVGRYPYLGVMTRTTNPVDSTKYIVYFEVSYDTVGTDTMFIPCDTLGGVDNTIFVITDSASTWLTRSVLMPVSRFVKIKIITDATDHGDRCGFWLETFLWRPVN